MSVSFLGANTVSVIDKGAIGNGLQLEDASFAAAATDLISRGGGTLYVPAGQYKLSRPLDLLVPGMEHVAIRGLGKYTTRLEFVGTAGGIRFASTTTAPFDRPTLEIQDVGLFAHASDMGTAIEATWADDANVDAAFTAKGVVMRQSKVYGAKGFWTRGIDTLHGRNSTIADIHFIGELQGGEARTAEAIRLRGQSTAVEIYDCQIIEATTAILAQDVCEGINVNQCNLVGVKYGVRHNIASGAEPQLSVANSHINATDVCVWSTNVQQGGMVNNLFYAFSGFGYVNNWWGVILDGALSRSMKVIGNSFEKDGGHNGATAHGVHIAGGKNYMVIGNQFQGRQESPMTYGIVGNGPGLVKSPNQAEFVTNPGF